MFLPKKLFRLLVTTIAMTALLTCTFAFADFGDSLLKEGAKGDDVKTLQAKLLALGYFDGQLTGQFGDLTEKAVKAFQTAKGLPADGIVGESTYAALGVKSTISRGAVSQADNIIKYAEKFLGTPYRSGGMSPKGFDCSGYVKYVFGNNGITYLNRTASGMYKQGSKVAKSELQRGDLVFFKTGGQPIGHVGIYYGGGKFIHSGTSTGVTISKLSESYWSKRYVGATRVL